MRIFAFLNSCLNHASVAAELPGEEVVAVPTKVFPRRGEAAIRERGLSSVHVSSTGAISLDVAPPAVASKSTVARKVNLVHPASVFPRESTDSTDSLNSSPDLLERRRLEDIHFLPASSVEPDSAEILSVRQLATTQSVEPVAAPVPVDVVLKIAKSQANLEMLKLLRLLRRFGNLVFCADKVYGKFDSEDEAVIIEGFSVLFASSRDRYYKITRFQKLHQGFQISCLVGKRDDKGDIKYEDVEQIIYFISSTDGLVIETERKVLEIANEKLSELNLPVSKINPETLISIGLNCILQRLRAEQSLHRVRHNRVAKFYSEAHKGHGLSLYSNARPETAKTKDCLRPASIDVPARLILVEEGKCELYLLGAPSVIKPIACGKILNSSIRKICYLNRTSSLKIHDIDPLEESLVGAEFAGYEVVVSIGEINAEGHKTYETKIENYYCLYQSDELKVIVDSKAVLARGALLMKERKLRFSSHERKGAPAQDDWKERCLLQLGVKALISELKSADLKKKTSQGSMKFAAPEVSAAVSGCSM